jgi:hypothetical protein
MLQNQLQEVPSIHLEVERRLLAEVLIHLQHILRLYPFNGFKEELDAVVVGKGCAELLYGK